MTREGVVTVEVRMLPGLLNELRHRAGQRGITVTELMRRAVAVEHELFANPDREVILRDRDTGEEVALRRIDPPTAPPTDPASGGRGLHCDRTNQDGRPAMTGPSQPPAMAVGADLIVGKTVRVEGTYIAHWEWPRFIMVGHRRRWLAGQTLCKLEPRPGLAADVYVAAGVRPPLNRRRAGGVRFAVVADVTPVEPGHFGHLGTLQWRLRVENWVAVTPAAPKQRRPLTTRIARLLARRPSGHEPHQAAKRRGSALAPNPDGRDRA